MASPWFLASVAAAAAVLITSTHGAAAQQPQPPGFPALFYGSVVVDGRPPAEGSRVTALINGIDCTQANSGRMVVEGGTGVYSITVVHENQKAGCGAEGRTVSFRVNGVEANQRATWKPGTQEVGLSVGAATPPPLPTATLAPTQAGTTPANDATATSAAQFTPLPRPSVLPTDDPGVLGAATTSGTSTRAPVPGATAAAPRPAVATDDAGISPWLVAVLAAVLAAGVGGGVVLARRR